MTNQPTPNWQSIHALPILVAIIEGTLENTEAQYQRLLEVKVKPWVLNDALVTRVIQVFKTQLDDLWLYEAQLAHWKKTNLTTPQQQAVADLKNQIAQLRQVTESVLALAEKLKGNTLDQLLVRDDDQLALDVLTGKLL